MYTLAEANAEIEAIKQSVEQNTKTVRIDSIIAFLEKYCEESEKDNGWGESYPIWQISHNDRYGGFSDIQEMINKIIEIDSK